jgi:hypothetical protein
MKKPLFHIAVPVTYQPVQYEPDRVHSSEAPPADGFVSCDSEYDELDVVDLGVRETQVHERDWRLGPSCIGINLDDGDRLFYELKTEAGMSLQDVIAAAAAIDHRFAIPLESLAYIRATRQEENDQRPILVLGSSVLLNGSPNYLVLGKGGKMGYVQEFAVPYVLGQWNTLLVKGSVKKRANRVLSRLLKIEALANEKDWRLLKPALLEVHSLLDGVFCRGGAPGTCFKERLEAATRRFPELEKMTLLRGVPRVGDERGESSVRNRHAHSEYALNTSDVAEIRAALVQYRETLEIVGAL